MLVRTGLLCVALSIPPASSSAERTEDHRAWQHGVDLLRVNGRLLVVWGSAGNPPKGNPGGSWEHDVYYAWIAAESRTVIPKVLVSRPEAQEPPSTAINASGTILMTAEDGEDGIHQLAGLWNSSLKPLRKYPFTIRRGGHSGHTAAVGNRFLVTYSEDWVKGGGFRDLGTGKDVYARIVENDGRLGAEANLSGTGDGHRDDWPLVAGSDRNWLVVWQRHAGATLQSALIDHEGKMSARRTIAEGLPPRYAYDVAFAPPIGRFVVAGVSGEDGFVSLVNLDGTIVATRAGLPPIASESRVVIGTDRSGAIAVYPVKPSGVAVVRISANSVELLKLVKHPFAWDYAGTTGMFVKPDRVLFATLSRTGLHLVHVNLGLKK